MTQARQTRHSAQSARRDSGIRKKHKAPVTSPEDPRKQLPHPGWRPAVWVKTRVWVGCPVSRAHKTWSRSLLYGFSTGPLFWLFRPSTPRYINGGDDYSKIFTFLTIPETPKAA